MKIIFCGTPEFALPSLNTLLTSKHQVLAVITPPDRPAGRGKKLKPSAIKEAASTHNLPILQPGKIGSADSLESMRQLNPDALAVVAFGQLLPPPVLNLPRYGCINVHASLLPKYRGAAPINWAIIRGETQTGVCTMRLDKGMDTGDVILCKAVDIRSEETAGTLHDKLAPLGAQLLAETLDQIEANTALYHPQDHNSATYAPLLDKSITIIDWKQSAEQIDCLVRGLNPYPGAKTFLDDLPLKILTVEISKLASPALPGQIIQQNRRQGILVATGSAPIWLKTIQPANRQPMTSGDFLSGLRESLINKEFRSPSPLGLNLQG
ncbi:MAG: methionyl-tRNA formyltransferase [Candidatus Schekmanbacteria bacterium]|nr:methionyl-tRNA formyltransferase [Candidatus Schekmanbacteria bacterium]